MKFQVCQTEDKFSPTKKNGEKAGTWYIVEKDSHGMRYLHKNGKVYNGAYNGTYGGWFKTRELAREAVRLYKRLNP